MHCQRAYSIRTRIKTYVRIFVGSCTKNVREHIPLEQGLRLFTKNQYRARTGVREHIPLEQGLRLGGYKPIYVFR